jgi:ornithine cyclodeaminase
MLVLNAEDVRQALPMVEAIEGMKRAYAALSTDRAEVPLRSRLDIAGQEATGLFMPAFVPGEAAGALAVKVVTLFPENIPAGLPLIHAAVLVMDANNGQMLALLEGGSLTAIRTGAGAGAATDLLARPESNVLALFGSGVQARTQLEAVCAVRPIREVRIYSPNPDHIQRFIGENSPPAGVRLLAAGSPADALQGADIICTATTSSQPVFSDRDVPPGAHINAVGSYTPAMVEIPPRTLGRAEVVALDSQSACRAEAGEVIAAVDEGLLTWDETIEVGALVTGAAAGRQTERGITSFKSVGVAVQDAVAGQITLDNARRLGLGQPVRW